MFRMIYVSTAKPSVNKETLVDILNQAREKNARLGITGMLLYKDGNFMQLLEGEEQVVRDLYDTIARDDRHFDSLAIFADQAEERMFADWTMGFHDLGDPALRSLPGFAPFRDIDFSRKGVSADVAACLDVLAFFRNSR